MLAAVISWPCLAPAAQAPTPAVVGPVMPSWIATFAAPMFAERSGT